MSAPSTSPSAIAALVLARSPRVLFLDYDGTLVPFARTPELARPDAELLLLLEELGARPDTDVHVVSGRSRASLEAWLGHLPIGLHAEHGYWRRASRRHAWVTQLVPEQRRWLRLLERVLVSAVEELPGALLERKSSSLAFHFRNADPEEAGAAAERLRAELLPVCARHGLALLDGNHVLEIRPEGVHKGSVVREVLTGSAAGAVLAVGDDTTDLDMFAALPDHGVAVVAGDRLRDAQHRLPGPPEVRELLALVAAAPIAGVEAVSFS